MALSLAYGIQIKPINDPFIDLAESALNTATMAARVGAFLVDVIPILKYIPEFMPGAGFQKKARMWRKLPRKTLFSIDQRHGHRCYMFQLRP